MRQAYLRTLVSVIDAIPLPQAIVALVVLPFLKEAGTHVDLLFVWLCLLPVCETMPNEQWLFPLRSEYV